jgi:hypothetical protein
MKKNVLVLALIFALITNFQIMAQRQRLTGEWEIIGTRKVDYKLDRDVIVVTAMKGKFTKLKLMVKGGAINFHDMKVYFGNGMVQDVEIRNNIAAGGETRVIDLRGNERIITKIELIYDTKNFANRRGTVIVLAKE